MHLSLDGFVAGPKGEMDWIKINDDIFRHVEERIQQTDTALYGRKTFEMMEAYWPAAADKPAATRHDIEHSAWYGKAHKVVLSNTLMGEQLPNTTIISENLRDELAQIKQKAVGEVLLFGSPTATHSLMEQDLVDGYWLFVNPILLGRGIPLFNGIQNKTALELVSIKPFACGVTELNYTVNRV